MRWLVGFFFLVVLTVFGGYVFLRGYPYSLYSDWAKGKNWNKYYTIDDYRSELLAPSEVPEVPPYREDYAQLWKDFPVLNAHVPLPVRHPFFQTIPYLESRGKKASPSVGIVILNPSGREITRIYTRAMTIEQDYSLGQELFKLPFVRNRILKFPKEKVWKNVFDHKIEVKSKSLDEMIYDLYILHIRSKMLPKEIVSYSLLSDDKAMIVFESKDRDYSLEMVLSYSNGNIYSYVLRTEKNNPDSVKLRSKFLGSISFTSIDPSYEKFLYTEFKQMSFDRQIDQEGMLYLLSAWTQNMSNTDLFKEMIFYLERGRNPFIQLKPLYSFALAQYGKTFSTRKVFSGGEDPNIILQRKIELEAVEKMREAQREKDKAPLEPELTPEEKMNLYLRKAKETGPSEKEDMTVH